MTLIQAILLGLIQGLTEFLPVSSSGHLALTQYLMKLPEIPIAFDVLLHLATLVAVCIVLYPQIKELFLATSISLIKGKYKEIPSLFWLLMLGSLPAGILGLLLNDYMETIFSSVKFFSIGFLITGMFLSIASRLKPGKKEIGKMSWQESLKIGLFQALAIFPSISRSGSTITGALWQNLKVADAFNFSFLLSIPAILGAGVLHASSLANISQNQVLAYLSGFIVALISGLLALKLFRSILIKRKLSIFAYYCIFLSLMIFFFIK